MRTQIWQRHLTNGKTFLSFRRQQNRQNPSTPNYLTSSWPTDDHIYYEYFNTGTDQTCQRIEILIDNKTNTATVYLATHHQNQNTTAIINALNPYRSKFPQNIQNYFEYGTFDLSKPDKNLKQFISTLQEEISLPTDIETEIARIFNIEATPKIAQTNKVSTNQQKRENLLQTSENPIWEYDGEPIFQIGDITSTTYMFSSNDYNPIVVEIEIITNKRTRSACVRLGFDENNVKMASAIDKLKNYEAPLEQHRHGNEKIYGIFDLCKKDKSLNAFMSILLDLVNLKEKKEEIIETLHLTPNMNTLKNYVATGEYGKALTLATDIDKTLKWEAIYTTAQYLSEHYQQQANKTGLQESLHKIKLCEIKAYQAVPNTSFYYHQATCKLQHLMCDLNFQVNLTPEQCLNHKEMQFKYALNAESDAVDLIFSELCGAPGLSKLIKGITGNWETLCNTAKVIREQNAEIKRLKIKYGETPATCPTQTTTPGIFTQSSTTKNKRKRTQNEPTGKPTTPDETIKHPNKKQRL